MSLAHENTCIKVLTDDMVFPHKVPVCPFFNLHQCQFQICLFMPRLLCLPIDIYGALKKKKKNWCLWWRPFYMEQKPTWKGTLSVSFLDIFSACSEPLKHLGRVFFWHMHDPWQWHVLCYFFCLSRCILFNMIFKILVVTCILYV